MSTPATPEHVSADQLADLHAGLLDASESEIVRRHLTECDACAGLSDDIAAVPGILAEAAGPIEMPVDLASSLDEAISRAQAERAAGVSSLSDRRAPADDARPGRRVARWLPAAAAAVLVVGIGAGTWRLAFDGSSNGQSADSGASNAGQFNSPAGSAGSMGSPVRLTPQNVDAAARALASSASSFGYGVGGSAPSPHKTFGTKLTDPAGCPTPASGVSKRVLWLGKPAVLTIDRATRTARVLGCAPARHILFSTHF